jgi:hypothetical protein
MASGRPAQLGVSIALVVYMIRRTSSGNAKNGMTSGQFLRLDNSRVFLTPWAVGKVVKSEFAGIGVLGFVDLLQGCRPLYETNAKECQIRGYVRSSV